MSLFVNIKSDNTGYVDRTENTTRFFRDIAKYPTMTRDDEIEWFGKMHNGTESEKREARDYIIKCNQRFVVSIAKKWANTDSLMDYVNEANIGLMEAIEKFDETKNFKFSTYAIWFIVRAINKYNNTTAQVVKRTNQCKTFHVISKAQDKFVQKYHREPSSEELKDMINNTYGKSIKDKHDLLNVRVTSIDESVLDDNEYMFNDVYDFQKVTASVNGYEAAMDCEYDRVLTESLLNVLTEREQEIIKMVFGLVEVNGIKREFELCEIAESMGLTTERVRQLKNSSIEKMRKEYERRINEVF